jgi:hypothetical protein
MSKEIIEKLVQEPNPHSAYIEDAELRDMVIVWAVVVRNANELAEDEKYIQLIADMMDTNPELYKRFRDYLVNTFEDAALWSEPANRIRKTLLSK